MKSSNNDGFEDGTSRLFSRRSRTVVQIATLSALMIFNTLVPLKSSNRSLSKTKIFQHVKFDLLVPERIGINPRFDPSSFISWERLCQKDCSLSGVWTYLGAGFFAAVEDFFRQPSCG
ncbi:MAG TPA: hypothetical protein VE954_03720 [Oligoflexus sp.]|uniref:hypothetical protein n=1 Tax=Oligoflexus sp. TaxID=1971216 RepID=UPI002D62C1ED|nr:hypothetical protein [Oligoflexus sp.]HYX32195.1 hypothetical protein [Oligoflexus sp.]